MAPISRTAVAAPMAAVAAPTATYKPIMLAANQKWSPVHVASMMTISGGVVGNSREIVPTRSIDVPGVGERSFVELNKNNAWLQKLVKGKGGIRNGSLHRSKICEELRTRVKALGEVCEDESPAAVAAGDELSDHDPMNAIIVSDAPNVEPKSSNITREQTRQLKRKRGSSAAHRVRIIDVDMHPPMTNTSQNSKLDVRVVYIPSISDNKARPKGGRGEGMGAKGGGQGKLWLQTDHIPWLAAYVADECACGGIGVPDDDSAPPAECNCDVPGLHIQFCFAEGRYTATFVTGPLSSHEQRQVSTLCSTMSSAKWAELVAQGKLAGEFDASSPEQRTTATELYIKMHCQRMLDMYESDHATDTGMSDSPGCDSQTTDISDSPGCGSANEPLGIDPAPNGALSGA